MAHKPHQQHSGDDWAGLAQNLFGINLDKPKSGDDDLLDDDMFKVELPKPPAPPPVVVATTAHPIASIAQEEIEFASAESVAQSPVRIAPVAASRPSTTKAAQSPTKVAPKADAFGAGVDDFGFGVVEEVAEAASEFEDDDGLTLPDDYDSEGLTLPSDYDDGLTLAPEALAEEEECGEDEDDDDDEFEDDEDDSEELSADDSDEEFEDDDDEVDEDDEEVAESSSAKEASAAPSASGSAAASRHKRPFRRTREDAYWDMLENWEWEEIPASDAPRADGGRSQSGGRGRDRDRKGSGGRGSSDRGRRGDRPRDDRAPTEQRARSADRPASSDKPVADERTREQRPQHTEDRPRSAERPTVDSSRERSAEGSGDRSRPPRDDRARQDRPREDRPREERPRSDARPAASLAPAPRQSIAPKVEQSAFDDFGLGIFESEPTSKVPPAPAQERRPREEAVAQSSVAADKILRTPSSDTARSRHTRVEEELVWPEADDSDVQLVPAGSISETAAIPSAGAADESEELDESSDESSAESSDVTELNEDGTPRRGRRRRRRGRRRRPGEVSAEGSEGTTFDLNDALAGSNETPDFILANATDEGSLTDADDSDDESSESGESSEGAEGDQPSERRGRRRRRRRRRPSDAVGSVTDGEPTSASTSEEHSSELAEASADHVGESHHDAHDLVDEIHDLVDDDHDDDEVPVITYAKMPSWEEAIRYLLNPHLVGKNLDPEDEAESLVGDPRGSGGSEPVAAPPQRRFRRGGSGNGGGRGRR